MINAIKEQVKNAIEKTITEMGPFKTQAPERYSQLVKTLSNINDLVNSKLDAMENEIGLKAVGINDAKGFISYLTYTTLTDRYGSTGKQLAALIQKNI